MEWTGFLQMSILQIVPSDRAARYAFEDIHAISECGLSSFHTPIRFVGGYQCATRITDLLSSEDYPHILFFTVAIRGADDYLDCGGRLIELEKGVMIPIHERFFTSHDKSFEGLKQALLDMKSEGIEPRAFRANQWRSIRGQELPTYSCSEDQPSGAISFATTEPDAYSVHTSFGDILVDTSRFQSSISLKEFLDIMNKAYK